VFIGHYALGLASKRIAPSVSLGALFLACQFADLLWPTLVLAGVESFTIRPGITAVTPLCASDLPMCADVQITFRRASKILSRESR
jgi:hypothetical protein